MDKSFNQYYHPFKRGCTLPRKARQVCLNVYSRFKDTSKGESVDDVVKMTANACGVSCTTVYRLRQTMNQEGKLTCPGKKRPRKKESPQKCDEFSKNAIRRKVHCFFFKNKLPNLRDILFEVNSDPELPNISKSTLHRILTRDLGFKFLSRKRNSKLIDREDIITWRCRYLREIAKYRKEGRHIYYLDETWCNASHTLQKVGTHTSVKGLKIQSGKGQRLVILHIGSSEGWVPNAQLVFVGKKTGDYPEEINSDFFEKWLQETLPKLKEQSVIVLDNASYHTRSEKLPTSDWRKSEIADWLKSKGEVVDEDYKKAELLTLAQELKKKYENKYAIEDLVEATGRKLLWLPPYHCELNPIEMVWVLLKEFVAKNNTTFKMSDVRKLVETGLANINNEDWQKCITHVVNKVEVQMREMDNILDAIEERIMSTSGEDSDESDDDSDEGTDYDNDDGHFDNTNKEDMQINEEVIDVNIKEEVDIDIKKEVDIDIEEEVDIDIEEMNIDIKEEIDV